MSSRCLGFFTAGPATLKWLGGGGGKVWALDHHVVSSSSYLGVDLVFCRFFTVYLEVWRDRCSKPVSRHFLRNTLLQENEHSKHCRFVFVDNLTSYERQQTRIFKWGRLTLKGQISSWKMAHLSIYLNSARELTSRQDLASLHEQASLSPNLVSDPLLGGNGGQELPIQGILPEYVLYNINLIFLAVISGTTYFFIPQRS